MLKLFRVSCLVFSVLVVFNTYSYAALDIFSHPKDIEKEQKIKKVEAKTTFLGYPKECFLKGNYREAFNGCQRLLDYPPAWEIKGEISYLMGLSCLKMGRYLEARSYFNDVLLMHREDLIADACLGIADSYFLEEKFDKALEAYNDYLSKYPDNENISGVYYKMGEIFNKEGQSEKAKYYFSKVIQDFPFSFEARLLENAAKNETRPAEAVSVPAGACDNTGGSDSYSVQTGCFKSKNNAAALCRRLQNKGFDSYITESGGTYRVKVGRLVSKDEAQVLENRLKKSGFPTKVCP